MSAISAWHSSTVRSRAAVWKIAVPSVLFAVGACGVDAGSDEGGPLPGIRTTLPAVREPAIRWEPKSYAAVRAVEPPVIDGSLSDSTWAATSWTTPFVDIRGAGEPRPRYATRVKVAWDDRFLYVAAEIQDPHVWGTLRERDAVIYQDNDFEVFIDPDGDSHLYYELEINALGTVWDLMLIKPYRDGGPAVNAWNIQGLETAVAIDGTLNDPTDSDHGWSAEIAIPWGALAEAAGRAAPPEPGDRWRMNFSRVQWRAVVESGEYRKERDPTTGETLDEDNWVWSPQGLIAMHYPEMWGFVEFVEDPSAMPAAPTESERAMAALREVYYAQRSRIAGDPGASAAADLDPGDAPAEGILWPPTIYSTPSGFEAVLPLSDGRAAHIREDGRVWVSG